MPRSARDEYKRKIKVAHRYAQDIQIATEALMPHAIEADNEEAIQLLKNMRSHANSIITDCKKMQKLIDGTS